MTLAAIEPVDLQRRLAQGSAVLVDIRERDEFAREHIPGALPVPLSALDRQVIEAGPGKAVVFQCRSGNRTSTNAERLLSKSPGECYMLAGGLDAWKAAGLPVALDRSAPIDVQRQVQIAAGSLVLIGLTLGLTLSPWFLGLSAFVGAGLVFAGLSGFCGMARLLKHMPWNRGMA